MGAWCMQDVGGSRTVTHQTSAQKNTYSYVLTSTTYACMYDVFIGMIELFHVIEKMMLNVEIKKIIKG